MHHTEVPSPAKIRYLVSSRNEAQVQEAVRYQLFPEDPEDLMTEFLSLRTARFRAKQAPWYIATAYIGEQPVACALLRKGKSAVPGVDMADVMCFVKPKFRKHGIGSTLIKKLIRASRLSITKIFAYGGSARQRAFWKALGVYNCSACPGIAIPNAVATYLQLNKRALLKDPQAVLVKLFKLEAVLEDYARQGLTPPRSVLHPRKRQ